MSSKTKPKRKDMFMHPKTKPKPQKPKPQKPKPQKHVPSKTDQKGPTPDEIFWRKVNSCKTAEEFWKETVSQEELKDVNQNLIEQITNNDISSDSEESDNST